MLGDAFYCLTSADWKCERKYSRNIISPISVSSVLEPQWLPLFCLFSYMPESLWASLLRGLRAKQ